MKKILNKLLLLAAVLPLCHCSVSSNSGGEFSVASGLPEIVNVSAYDPKEKKRGGRSYSVDDVSALKENGACALIARAGKGGGLDGKCAAFLSSADRIGMLPGVYYRLQNHLSGTAQADQFVSRAQALAQSRDWNASHLLLCGDFDAQSRLSDILAFMDRVEQRTGVVPVAYLENSPHLKLLLGNADAATKAKLRRMPYWLALYSHLSGAGPLFPAPGHPSVLVGQYRVWSDWTMWQYGGVDWENGASQPKVYSHGRWRWSPYFGNLDRPVERNVFNGSHAQLAAFWQRHGIRLR